MAPPGAANSSAGYVRSHFDTACDWSAISTGVLQGQFRQQRFGQRVILVDRLEAELINGVRGHHLTV